MRYSVIMRDPGFENLMEVRKAGGTVAVYLDGVRLTDIHTVDEELGKAWGAMHEYDGRKVLIERDDGSLDYDVGERVYEGDIKVEIEYWPREPRDYPPPAML
jgi:hypothetical protein